MSRSYGPCLCCLDNFPDDMLSPSDDELTGQLCPQCAEHAARLVAEIKALREQLRDLQERATYAAKVRAGN